MQAEEDFWAAVVALGKIGLFSIRSAPLMGQLRFVFSLSYHVRDASITIKEDVNTWCTQAQQRVGFRDFFLYNLP